MTVTLVLKLVPERLAEGHVVGHAEHVESGRRAALRDLGDLVRFARAAGASGGGDGQAVGHELWPRPGAE